MTNKIYGYLFTPEKDIVLFHENKHMQQNNLTGFHGEQLLIDQTPLDAMVRIFEEYTNIAHTERLWANMGTSQEGNDNAIVFQGIIHPDFGLHLNQFMASKLFDDKSVVMGDPYVEGLYAQENQKRFIQLLADGKFVKNVYS